jgi:hypothetical protein
MPNGFPRRLLVRAAMLLAACSWLGLPQAPDPAAGVRDIESFIACLNAINPGVGDRNIASATRCVPKGCKITLTMSPDSAQPACSLGGCQLPRVLLNCPGPKDQLRFRPSFTLCPLLRGGKAPLDRVEIGEDTERVVNNNIGRMRMADVGIPPGTDFTTITPAGSLSKATVDGRGTKECNACHGDGGASAGGEQLSKPLHWMGRSQAQTNLQPYVIYSDEPGRLYTDTKRFRREGLKEICGCIERNAARIDRDARNNPPTDPVNQNPGIDVLLMGRLCRNLQAYGEECACGRGRLPDGSPAKCGQVRGGGKFLNGTAASVFNYDLSGQAKRDPVNFDFADIDGDLSAFDYASGTRIDGVILKSLKGATMASGDITVTAKGSAKVNGVATDIDVMTTRLGGVISYEIRNAANGMLIMSGAGEAGRSSLTVAFAP